MPDLLPYHTSTIIGGIITSYSMFYYLIKMRIIDAILIERNVLISETTWHSAIQVHSMRYSRNLIDSTSLIATEAKERGAMMNVPHRLPSLETAKSAIHSTLLNKKRGSRTNRHRPHLVQRHHNDWDVVRSNDARVKVIIL